MKLVGNKAKGRISKRVFQEKKTRKIFRKTKISYPLIRTPQSVVEIAGIAYPVLCTSKLLVFSR